MADIGKEAPMVQIDVPAAFAVGSLLADAARRQIEAGRKDLYYRAFLKNNLFQIFFFAWIPVYFIANYLGWETTYMWWHADSVREYPLFLPVFLVVFFAAGNMGFFLGSRLIAARHATANRMMYGAIAIFSLIWVFGQTGRTFKVGTYSQFNAGQAQMFWENSAFLTAFIVVMVVWSAGVIGFFLNLQRDGLRLGESREAAGASR
jgi:hypothetical protein